MSLSQAERTILELATEDFYGLWEVRWEIERLFPAAELDEVLARSREVVLHLLRRGWIDVFSGELKGNDMLPVDEAALAEVLGSPESWEQLSPDKPQLAIAATDAGERAYSESGK